MKRSDLCSMTIEEAAWEILNNSDNSQFIKHRKMMVGEFGEEATKAAIEGADSMRELMGMKRRFLRVRLREHLSNRTKELQDARTY